MPQVPGLPNDWTLAPPQSLEASEVDDFLKYLFSHVAKRPKRLLLKECAAVARYMRWLAWKGVPLTVLERGKEAVDDYRRADRNEADRDARWNVERTAEIVWETVL